MASKFMVFSSWDITVISHKSNLKYELTHCVLSWVQNKKDCTMLFWYFMLFGKLSNTCKS